VNSESLEGVTDPGAVAIAEVFAALAKGKFPGCAALIRATPGF
jgi:hypothetical protein